MLKIKGDSLIDWTSPQELCQVKLEQLEEIDPVKVKYTSADRLPRLKSNGLTVLPFEDGPVDARIHFKCRQCSNVYLESLDYLNHVSFQHCPERVSSISKIHNSSNTLISCSVVLVRIEDELASVTITKFVPRPWIQMDLIDVKKKDIVECEVCELKLVRSSLAGHMKLHSDDQRIHCHLCSHSNIRKVHLRNHIISKHGILHVKDCPDLALRQKIESNWRFHVRNPNERIEENPSGGLPTFSAQSFGKRYRSRKWKARLKGRNTVYPVAVSLQ